MFVCVAVYVSAWLYLEVHVYLCRRPVGPLQYDSFLFYLLPLFALQSTEASIY